MTELILYKTQNTDIIFYIYFGSITFVQVFFTIMKIEFRAAFNQHQVSDVCLLCGQGPEDMPHFISECPTLDFKREPHVDNIKRLCMKLEIVLPKARQELCCAILNAVTPLICTHIDCKPHLYECNHVNVFNTKAVTKEEITLLLLL